MPETGRGRAPIEDCEGRPFGELDFAAGDHLEVVLAGREVVRFERALFEEAAAGRPLRLKLPGEKVFEGRHVTTIDGIDLGRVVEAVRGGRGALEALVVGGRGEGGPLAVPLEFVREVAAHIILEPTAEEVQAAQGRLARGSRVRAALQRARGRP